MPRINIINIVMQILTRAVAIKNIGEILLRKAIQSPWHIHIWKTYFMREGITGTS